MYVQFKPIGFISTGEGWHRGIFVRFLRWHMAIKPTRCELFSERYGYTKTFRFAGWSMSFRRIREAPSSPVVQPIGEAP